MKSAPCKTVINAVIQLRYGNLMLIDEKLIQEECTKLHDYSMTHFFSIVEKFKIVELFKSWGGDGHLFKYTVVFVLMMEFYNLNIIIVDNKETLLYPLHYPFMVPNRQKIVLEASSYGFSILYDKSRAM